jgi:ribosomal protein L40E
MDAICSTLSEDILRKASPLWKETRAANEVMRLFDLTELPDVRDEDLQEIVSDATKSIVQKAPETSKFKRDLAACDRILKLYTDDQEIINNIRIAYNKSKPLILLNQAVLRGKDAGFTPSINTNVAILSGRNTSDPATQKIIPRLQEFIGNDEDIKPLGDLERHRIVFVQEIGGFSLRCIDGMQDLRQSYLDWKGEFIAAKRAQQAGESRDLPIPVHIQKESPFWDIFPEDASVFKLVIEARALKILRQEKNRVTNENVIRYEMRTATGIKKVDIAASWEEAAQVLEVKICRSDREEIQRQVTAQINTAQTLEQKQALYVQLIAYLRQRALELEKQGGEESPEYKREDKIILDLINAHKLNAESIVSSPQSVEPIVTSTQVNPSNLNSNVTQTAPTSAPTYIFCHNCGHRNPMSFNFCSKCGTRLVKT